MDLTPPHPRGVRSGCLWHGVGGPCLKVQADPDNTITPKYSEYDAFCQMGAMFWQRRGATRVCVCWTLLFSKNNWPQSLVVTAESACLWLWHWPTCWRRRCQSEIGGMLHHAAVRGRMPNRVPDLSCQKAPHWNSVQRHIVRTMGKLETLKNKCFLFIKKIGDHSQLFAIVCGFRKSPEVRDYLMIIRDYPWHEFVETWKKWNRKPRQKKTSQLLEEQWFLALLEHCPCCWNFATQNSRKMCSSTFVFRPFLMPEPLLDLLKKAYKKDQKRLKPTEILIFWPWALAFKNRTWLQNCHTSIDPPWQACCFCGVETRIGGGDPSCGAKCTKMRTNACKCRFF